MVSIRLDRLLNRFNSNRPRPRGIGDSRLLTCLGCTRQPHASGQVVFFVVSQLPLFCNTRVTGITADGAQLGSRPTPGCIRLLFAFFTGSSDLGCHRISILQSPKTAFLCSFLVTAGLQDKRTPFEPRGGPEMGKDKNQAGQMGPNPHPLWYRAPQVFCVPACHVDSDLRTGIPAPKHLGGSVPKGMWVGAHLTCLVFVFAHFGAAPGFKWRPFVL